MLNKGKLINLLTDLDAVLTSAGCNHVSKAREFINEQSETADLQVAIDFVESLDPEIKEYQKCLNYHTEEGWKALALFTHDCEEQRLLESAAKALRLRWSQRPVPLKRPKKNVKRKKKRKNGRKTRSSKHNDSSR